jgi:hypothetical protein
MPEQPAGTVRIRRTVVAEYDVEDMTDEEIIELESSEDQLAETFDNVMDNVESDTATVTVKR